MDIQGFRGKFNGVRANRYKIITGANSTLQAENGEIYIKALSIPGTQIGMIPVSFQGRQIKFSGDRQFGEWAITVYDSTIGNLRKSFEGWIDKMDGFLTHKINYNVCDPIWQVLYNDGVGQTNPGGSLVTGQTGFKLYNVWPVDISPIDLSYDMVDSFAEFTITLAYDYHESTSGTGTGTGTTTTTTDAPLGQNPPVDVPAG